MQKIIIFLLISYSLHAEIASINHEGVYNFGSDIVYNSLNNDDCALKINASNVLVNFNGHCIRQTSDASNITGIIITENLSNVRISNASISGLTGSGIIINPGCSEIRISNTDIIDCKNQGILVNGTAISTIDNLVIHQCTIANTQSSTTSAIGIDVYYARGLQLSNIVIGLTNSSFHAFGIKLDHCINAIMNNLELYGSEGFDTAAGIFFDNCSNMRLDSVHSTGNIATNTSSSGYGILIQNSNNISCNNCRCTANTALAGSAFGFVARNGSYNSFTKCVGQTSRASLLAAGFYTGGSETNVLITEGQGLNNQADMSLGSAYGILLDGTQDSTITNNVLVGNTGFEGYGLTDTTLDTDNFFAGNIAYGNATADYNVEFTTNSLPIDIASNNDFTAIKNSSKYMNISIQNNQASANALHLNVTLNNVNGTHLTSLIKPRTND